MAVFHCRQAVGVDHALDLPKCLLLDFGMQEHGLDEPVERAGRGVRARLEERPSDVRRLVVAEALGLLRSRQLLAEARLYRPDLDLLLDSQPVADTQSLFARLQLL